MMTLQVRSANSEVWRQRFGLSARRASFEVSVQFPKKPDFLAYGRRNSYMREAGSGPLAFSGGANVANLRPNVAISYRWEGKRQRRGLCGGGCSLLRTTLPKTGKSTGKLLEPTRRAEPHSPSRERFSDRRRIKLDDGTGNSRVSTAVYPRSFRKHGGKRDR
jgi:hypothetical protein